MSSYYAIVFGRNGASNISNALDSLMKQTIKPGKIIIIDDGSTDGMAEIVFKFAQDHPDLVEAYETDSNVSDFSKLPLLWNFGLRKEFDYHLIVPNDIVIVPNYAELILKEMDNNPLLIVCSGDYGNKTAISPHGGGRFVRQDFFFEHYPNGYARKLGYESEILERAFLLGFQTKVIHEADIIHKDALGHSHNFAEFGYGMKCLGYYPPYALARVVWDFFHNKSVGKKGSIRMLYYYLTFTPDDEGYYSRFDEELCRKIYNRQKKMLFQAMIYILLGKPYTFYKKRFKK